MSRGRAIQYAVVAAIFSKVSSAFLQVLSLPLAKHALGKEEFGVFSTVSLSLFVVSMMQLGIGPAMSRLIAEYHSKGDKEQERHIYLSGVALSVVVALVSVGLLVLIVSVVPVTTIFGDKFSEYESILKNALILGIGIFGVEIIMWTTDRALEGYMETHINHIVLSVANLVGALVVFFGVNHFRSITFLLLALFVPVIATRVVSTVILFRRHPHLISSLTQFSKKTFRQLFSDGLSFSLTGNLVYLVEVMLCGILVGRVLGPGEVAVYQVFATIRMIFTNLVTMVAMPYWTAAVNARGQGDTQWVRESTRKLLMYFGVLSGAVGIGMLTVGAPLIHYIFGDGFDLPWMLFFSNFLFLAISGWRDINLYIMVGAGKLRDCVVPICVGLVFSLGFGYLGLINFGTSGMFFGLTFGILLFPVWKLGVNVFAVVR